MAEPLALVQGPDRWQPSRAGLVGLWRYWEETFTFHRGRLLLRGPNGSGKSMALELLLPFLLDGDTSPSRLTSAAKSRGGMYDRVMTGSTESSRVGFAWVEFTLGEQVFTVGARIRASQSTARAEVAFFTTSLAVGTELHLLDATRTPLSRKSLTEAIGTTGRVHESAHAHRAAVREVLFPGFSADRYDSVISALLALRKEKLSQNLDLDKLSLVLSDALPPLDDHDIAAAAEGFERLDRRKAELADLERDVAEVRALARLQREYALAVVAAAASDVRSAESERDGVTRRHRQALEQLEAGQDRDRGLAAQRRTIDDRRDAIQVEVAALKESDAYRQGTNLVDLRNQATRLRELADREALRADQQAATHAEAVGELRDAEERQRTAAANETEAARNLDGAAEEVGARPALGEAAGLDDPDDAERFLDAWIQSKRQEVTRVDSALDDHDRAIVHRQHLDEQFAADEVVVEGRTAGHDQAKAELDRARSAYAEAVLQWAAGCPQLDADRLRAVLPRPPDDPQTVAAAVAETAALARADEAAARTRLAAEREAALQDDADARAERRRWEGEQLVDPEGPDWRSDRSALRGAPLWRLVDVAPGLSEQAVDGLEAALTGSGLIDAWVQPDGSVELGPDRADVTLTARPLPGRTLADVLVPAPPATGSSPVPSEVVAAVLGSIRLSSAVAGPVTGADQVEVATDGSYRLGSAAGRGPLRPARLLGAVARERHRLAHLAEIDQLLAGIAERLDDLDRHDDDLDRRRAALEAELHAQPPGRPVQDAVHAEAATAARLAEAGDRLERTRHSRRQAEEVVREALRALTALAALHGLPTERSALRQITVALERLARAAVTWARRRRDSVAAGRELRRAAGREQVALDVSKRATVDRDEADREATRMEQRVASLESTVGVEFAQLSQRIADLEAEQRANLARAGELRREAEGLQRRLGQLEAQVETAAAEREEAEARRDRTHRLLVAALTTFTADAALPDPGPLEGPTAVLAAARAVAADNPAVDIEPQAITRVAERVGERLHAAQITLGARVDFDRELAEEGWWVLRTTANGLHRKVSQLVSALSTELTEGKAELAEEEERLFEQTLAGSVRRALAERIRQANHLTDAINTQLRAVRTAAGGVEVRLKWDVDDDQPAAVKAARTLLLRDPADLSEAERSSLQAFVRARVDQARAELEVNAPWEARLRETLDYRTWHRFHLLLAHRDWEGFVPATPRRLQKLSTGERSIALHLPMIASVAAHYSGERGQPSRCPRLILLDELFAGVDAANRAQLFGTFATWDLDAVLTSDHEWCQYDTLDGIAIHYLHPPIGDDPVTSTRFTWDGRRRRIDPPAA